MKTIKKYWALLVAGIAALFGLFVIVSKKQNEKKSDKIKQKIDDNKQSIDQLQGKIEVIEEQRVEVKQDIAKHEEVIEQLEEQKETITVEPKTTSEAKENIINKTKRGRKPKNK